MPHDPHMQEVARYLQVYARSYDGVERDAFARSAYNRYYYGCFLLLRDLVHELETDWIKTPHKQYPDLLNGKITKRLKLERKKAHKSGDRELYSMIESSLYAVPRMANIIKQAYSLRLIADYQPDVPVNFSTADRFSLNDIEITQAHRWREQLFPLIADLRSTWKQFNA